MAISYVASLTGNSTSGGTFNISRPTGSTQDDIIFASICATSTASIGAFTWPSGWNVVATKSSSSGLPVTRWEVAWHVFATGETNYSVTIPSLTSGSRAHNTSAYRGCDTTTPIIETSMQDMSGSGGSNSAITTDTATSSVSGLWPVAAFVGAGLATNFSFTPGTGLSERADTSNTTATYRAGVEWTDTNGIVDASGGVSYSSTPNNSIAQRSSFIGLLQPPAAVSKHSCGILLG